MVIALSFVLVVVCVGVSLVFYARRPRVPGGWTKEKRRQALSQVTPESLEADYQEQRNRDEGPVS